jgi:hypothetical protein
MELDHPQKLGISKLTWDLLTKISKAFIDKYDNTFVGLTNYLLANPMMQKRLSIQG